MADNLEAANELERAMRHLGLKGVQGLTNVAGRELSDASFSPFWAKAEALLWIMMAALSLYFILVYPLFSWLHDNPSFGSLATDQIVLC